MTTFADEDLRARRKRLGISQAGLANVAGVSRDTVASIEMGRGSRRSLLKIERALAELEEAAGIDPAPLPPADAGEIEYEVIPARGARFIVRGAVADAEELERSVARIIQHLGSDDAMREPDDAVQ